MALNLCITPFSCYIFFSYGEGLYYWLQLVRCEMSILGYSLGLVTHSVACIIRVEAVYKVYGDHLSNW